MDPVFSFAIELEQRSTGLTQALHQQLRQAILDGRLAAGANLPATRKAAQALGVARNTVVAAYELLLAEGYVLPRKGAKAVVAPVAAQRSPVLRAPGRIDDSRLNSLWRAAQPMSPTARLLPPRSFRLGVPEHRYFPHAVWRRLSAAVHRDWSRNGFSYPPAAGIPALRAAIAGHAAFARAVVCTADTVMVCAGAQQAFDLLARLLVTPGRTPVAVEEPGYPPQRLAMAAAGALLRPVPVDDEGLCVDQLPRDVRVICVTPSHQSPTGVTLSARRRQQLLAFASTHGAVIIEDDYDGEFRFGGRPLDSLQTLDREGLVFYVGTFSKSLFPALRKGYVVVPDWAMQPLLALKQSVDPHGDALPQAVLARFISDGHLARHVRRMQTVYAERRRCLIDGLESQLADWLTLIPAQAGLHLAAAIREPHLPSRIIGLACKHLPGSQSTAEYSHGALRRPALAIGYSLIDTAQILPALSNLAAALEES